jgi:hypothetical protein
VCKSARKEDVARTLTGAEAEPLDSRKELRFATGRGAST